MKTISQLTDAVTAAKAALDLARQERAAAIIALSPHKQGDTFVAGGQTYKVERVEAPYKGSEVLLICRRKMASGKWSISTTPCYFKVEG